MSENPLLPNARLQQLYALMQRCRSLARKQPGRSPVEAVLAAAMLQLEPTDFLSPLPGSTAAVSLAAERSVNAGSAPQPQTEFPDATRLTAIAALALGLKLAAPRGADSRIALAFATAGAASARTTPDWAAALRLAQSAAAPLLLLCVASEARGKAAIPAGALSWTTVNRVAKPLRLPVIPVDGTDAVAIFRVVQESALRARHGGGPAVLWCVLPRTASAESDPLTKLRSYMRARKIPIRA